MEARARILKSSLRGGERLSGLSVFDQGLWFFVDGQDRGCSLNGNGAKKIRDVKQRR